MFWGIDMDTVQFKEKYQDFSKYLADTYQKKLNISTDELFDRIEADCLAFCKKLWADKIITDSNSLEAFKIMLLSSVQLNRFAAFSVK